MRLKCMSDGIIVSGMNDERQACRRFMVSHQFRYVGLWLILFGISMGYFEAAVVADLRAISCPDNHLFPLGVKSDRLGLIELGREFFSLVMLISVACLAAPSLVARIACFFALFGIWDIFFYIFLKFMIGWPESLLTWDLLFLIPVPWVGPVLAPVIVSLVFIIGGFLIMGMDAKGFEGRYPGWCGLGLLLAMIIIAGSFCLDWHHIASGGLPRSFPWGIFLAGALLLIGVFGFYCWDNLSARNIRGLYNKQEKHAERRPAGTPAATLEEYL